MGIPFAAGPLTEAVSGRFHSFLDEIRMIVEDGSFVSFVPIELSDFFSP